MSAEPDVTIAGLTSGHRFIVPNDKTGVEVPQMFRRAGNRPRLHLRWRSAQENAAGHLRRGGRNPR
jgi:hypothetical protein